MAKTTRQDTPRATTADGTGQPAAAANAARTRAHAAPSVPQAANPPAEPPFVPTVKQLAFMAAACQAIAEGTTLSNRALCEAADVSLQTLWNWKHETPAFNDWLADQVRRHATAPADWELVKAMVYARAKEGSVEHIKLAVDLQKHALAIGTNGVPVAAGGTTLIFNIPRPPSELEGKTVVTGAIEVTQK